MGQNDSNAERLKRCGLKNTRRRGDVMRVLENSRQPVTAEEVFFALKENNRSISLSTVYRVLDTLVEKEIASRIASAEGGCTMFELNRRIHRHYLVCLGCHRMIPVDNCPLGNLERRLERETGFTVTGHSLEIYGYCADCQKQRSSGETEK